MYTLRVDNLSKWYPVRRSLGSWARAPFRTETLRALYQVGFSMEAGEILALLGPNGSGKSTILKILTSLVLPSSGVAEIEGMDVVRHSVRTRERIGYCMSEERSFYYRLTGRQNLRFFGRIIGLPAERIDDAIDDAADLLQIQEIENRFMTYSTGTRQKLAVARSILGGRPVLLLDEPTAGLDPYTASLFLERLRRMAKEEGKSILFASHDLEAVDRVADRLVFLHRGELLAQGAPEQVLSQFDIPRQIDIEVSDPREGWLDRIRNTPGVLQATATGESAERGRCRVLLKSESSGLNNLIEMRPDCFGEIRLMEIRRGSLEEIYKHFAEEGRE